MPLTTSVVAAFQKTRGPEHNDARRRGNDIACALPHWRQGLAALCVRKGRGFGEDQIQMGPRHRRGWTVHSRQLDGDVVWISPDVVLIPSFAALQHKRESSAKEERP